MGHRLGYAPGSARPAKASALAAERHQRVMPALIATQPQKAVGQDAALEANVELVFDELRQVCADCGLGLLKEGGGVLLHQAVARTWFGAVALVVGRGAIQRPPGLPADGLHAMHPTVRLRTASNRALRLNRPGCRLPLHADCCWSTTGCLGARPTGRFGATSSRQRTSLMGGRYPAGRPIFSDL